MCKCGCNETFNIHNNPKSFFYIKKDNKKKKTTLKEEELYIINNKKKIKKKNNDVKKKYLKKKSYTMYSNGKVNNTIGGKNKANKTKSNRINVKDISNKIEKIINSDKKPRPDFIKRYGASNRY